MEQTVRSYAETEQGGESSNELEPVFNEREQVLEAFASTPMAYTVNGTTYKANGSYEAVMLCEFLQNEKLPAAFFAIKFQQAADLFVTLNEDELKSVDEAVAEEAGASEKPPQAVEDTKVVESGEAPVKLETSPNAEDSHTGHDAAESSSGMSTEPLAAEIVPNIEVASAADTTVEESRPNDEIADSAEAPVETVANVDQLIIPETRSEATEQVPAQSSNEIFHEEVVPEDLSFEVETIQNNQPEEQMPSISTEELKNDDDELSSEEDASSIDSSQEKEGAVYPDDALQPQLDRVHETEVKAETEADSIDLLDATDASQEILEYDRVDVPQLEALSTPAELTDYPEERDDEIAAQEFLLPSLGEHAIEVADESDDIDPLQQGALIEIDELLTELSYSVEAVEDDESHAIATEGEPARIEQLFKCLEAQIQAVSELDDADAVWPIQDTLTNILTEADVDDPEHLARLYLQTYGVNQLADIIQLPVLAKAKRSNQLIEKYRKIARFATRLIIQHEESLSQGKHSLMNAA